MTSERPVTMPGSVSLSDRQPPPGHRQHAAAAVSPAAAETVMMSGPGSVVLPAGIINPSVPIRNIKMKFAVLTGLIQVGEVSNRDIVETVLNLVNSHQLCSGQHSDSSIWESWTTVESSDPLSTFTLAQESAPTAPVVLLSTQSHPEVKCRNIIYPESPTLTTFYLKPGQSNANEAVYRA